MDGDAPGRSGWWPGAERASAASTSQWPGPASAATSSAVNITSGMCIRCAARPQIRRVVPDDQQDAARGHRRGQPGEQLPARLRRQVHELRGHQVERRLGRRPSAQVGVHASSIRSATSPRRPRRARRPGPARWSRCPPPSPASRARRARSRRRPRRSRRPAPGPGGRSAASATSCGFGPAAPDASAGAGTAPPTPARSNMQSRTAAARYAATAARVSSAIRSALIAAAARQPGRGGRRSPAPRRSATLPATQTPGTVVAPVGSAGDVAADHVPAHLQLDRLQAERRQHVGAGGEPRRHHQRAAARPPARRPAARRSAGRRSTSSAGDLARRPRRCRGRPAARAPRPAARGRCAGRASRRRSTAATAAPGARPSARWPGRRSPGRAPPSRGSTGSAARRGPTARPRPGTSGSSSTSPVVTSSRRARTVAAVGQGRRRNPSSSRRSAASTRPVTNCAAVPGHLGAAGREQLGRRRALPAQVVVHVAGRARCAARPRRSPAPTAGPAPAPAPRSARPRRRRPPPRRTLVHRSAPLVVVVWRPPSPPATGSASIVAGMANDGQRATSSPRVGPRLRALRHQRGITLDRAAETTGISVSTLSRLESGQRRPTLELLLPLARAHQVPLDELVDAPATGDPRVAPEPFVRARRDVRAADPPAGRPAGVQADLPAGGPAGEPEQQIARGLRVALRALRPAAAAARRPRPRR